LQALWRVVACVDEGQTLTIEELINLQEAGSRARVLGLGSEENPYLSPDCTPPNDNAQEERQARLDAWKFGWEAENASCEGTLSTFVSSLLRSDAP